MARMRAVDAIVQILEKEGATQAFGVPGAAINPFYSAMEKHGGIRHVLARHPEAASHMAEGYTRTKPGNIGIAIATSGPGGTDLITGMYSAGADSTGLLCITGQVATSVLHKEEFQGVDIAAIAKPVTKYAETVLEGAQVPGAVAKAFQAIRSGRPGSALIDLPTDVQLEEIEFDIDAYEPLPVDKPVMSRYQADTILDMLDAAEHPVLVAGGGVISSGSTDLFVELAEYLGIPVISTLMGWGTIPDDHNLAQGMAGIQTSQRYANASMLASDLVIGIGNRWAARATGALDVFRAGRKFVHVDIDATQIGRVFPPDFWSVSDAGEALKVLLEAAKDRYPQPLNKYDEWVAECNARRCSPDMLRKTNFDNVPLKPQRVYQAMNEAFGQDTRYVTTIGLSQIAAAQFLHVYRPNHWINAGQAGPLGWTMPAALGAATADPNTPVVALSGDYDFGFLIEELAVGAQHEIPYVHVLVHNAYLGLIRQGQRAFGIDYQLQLSFKNQSSDTDGYGVDHVKVAEGMGCKGIRVREPDMLVPALKEAQQIAQTFRVPVVVECILERVTNISMGTSIDNINEFEEMAVDPKVDAPTAICFQLKK